MPSTSSLFLNYTRGAAFYYYNNIYFKKCILPIRFISDHLPEFTITIGDEELSGEEVGKILQQTALQFLIPACHGTSHLYGVFCWTELDA